MKYIRTKSGVMTEEELQEFGRKQWENCKKVDILKQADNIEELCDELVARSKKTGETFVILLKRYKLYDLEKYEIYGAIWTDKGLIYVAKMNEKGELKLL